MSISTPQSGGSRRPSATKATAGGKPNLEKKEESAGSTPSKAASKAASKSASKAASKAAGRTASATKAGAKAASSRPAAKAGAGARPAAKGGGRRPLAPVKVSQGRNWGPIAMFAAVILVAVGIIGYAGWRVYESALTVSDRVGAIDGAVNFRKSQPDLVKAAQHQSGPIKYEQNPPVAGKHNADWQNCMGEVYDAPIASEHAVHSMEHGAVWLVYNPAKVDAAQKEALAGKVRGKEYALMSPMENLDTTVSVQAWGFQLKTDNPSDKRIDEFIKATRKNAGVEQAQCSGGITETGTTPRDLQQQTGG
ncbi:DUF3105 domain-containing protein [Virgisporangium ochraceum]|uniref:DUF3105 domain-containing protein n=1 Tax=Virgisporangium ochraceum TaxID=65505 RepID=A0A8J3ZXF7_9ACTN|nr:DUF3105 domain-containing protein [Virgisporangium ochraceum]GIJ69953.1 hypothetical protein Voc01_048700 [Virgisporangium ochraceum]